MQLDELKSIHAWIRQTAISEIVFVSSLILPLFVLMYDFAAERISPDHKPAFILVGVVFYIAGIVWMKLTQSRNEKNMRDLTLIINHIVDQDFTYMSFDQIQELDSAYTLDRVRELVFLFPNHIRFGTLSGGRKGIRVLNFDKEDS